MIIPMVLLALQASSGGLAMSDEEKREAVVAGGVWETCVSVLAKKYASTREPATVIVDNALETCAGAETAYKKLALRVLLSQPGNSQSVALDASDYAATSKRNKIRTSVMREVFELRLPKMKK